MGDICFELKGRNYIMRGDYKVIIKELPYGAPGGMQTANNTISVELRIDQPYQVKVRRTTSREIASCMMISLTGEAWRHEGEPVNVQCMETRELLVYKCAALRRSEIQARRMAGEILKELISEADGIIAAWDHPRPFAHRL